MASSNISLTREQGAALGSNFSRLIGTAIIKHKASGDGKAVEEFTRLLMTVRAGMRSPDVKLRAAAIGFMIRFVIDCKQDPFVMITYSKSTESSSGETSSIQMDETHFPPSSIEKEVDTSPSPTDSKAPDNTSSPEVMSSSSSSYSE